MSIMLTASEARSQSMHHALVHDELRKLEKGILGAVAQGKYAIMVLTNTKMTGPADTVAVENPDVFVTAAEELLTEEQLAASEGYYSAWKGDTVNKAMEREMNSIIQYFSDLGYVIERRVNQATGKNFKWVVYW
jgi:hypothetical protein